MWDGRASSIAEQIPMPLEGPEMAVDWAQALLVLEADPKVAHVARANGIAALTRDVVIGALANYVASLTAGSSRFDRYYYGDDKSALTTQEVWGLRLFVRKARCSSCHLLDALSAPFTDGALHATGIGYHDGEQRDVGRAKITGASIDVGLFKTPSLRNVELRPFLMHDGSFTSLSQVVDYYASGTRSSPNLDPRIRPLYLDRPEVEAIVAFLKTLTSENNSERIR